MEHMFKQRSPTFSFTTPNNEWISLSRKTTSELWWMLSFLIRLTQIRCSEHQQQQHMQQQCFLGEDMILHRTNIGQSFQSPCYWNTWVRSFSFWFNLDNLCTNHYHASSMVFFNPLDVCFSWSTMCVHNLIACANHNNSSIGYLIW
jgi:hypothetical protein